MPSKPADSTALIGVVLMTYGSATTSADVVPFLKSVYRTESPPSDMIAEFKRRFDLIGHSPLIEITKAQAEAVERQLNLSTHNTVNNSYLVRAGMLHSQPSIESAVSELKAAGAERVYGLLMSPQYSPVIMAGYNRSLQAAADKAGYYPDDVGMIGPWPDQPEFIEYVSTQLIQRRQELSNHYKTNIPIVLTTHSLPESVIKRDPSYLDQLQTTINAIIKRINLQPNDWTAAYQSAGHSPEPWLKPDLTDIFDALQAQKAPVVLIVPLQFLADHLEILYDLDIAAAAQAEEVGITYHRINLPNTHPLFIQALARIVVNNATK